MNQLDVLSVLERDDICKCLDIMSEIHSYTKTCIILAEELSEEGDTFLQPLKEHRDAYDHLMRVFALPFKVGHKDADTNFSNYIAENINKALGHEYRAFFDAADWLTFICRKKIREQLSLRSIKKRYKEKYSDYSETQKFINSLPFSIATYRDDKDVSKGEDILGEVLLYKETIDKLISIYQKVQTL